jgi:hypothetical protein
VGRALFVAHQDVADVILLKTMVGIDDGASRQAEDDVHSLPL